ncbi:MAG TPA: MFS transporter [Nitrospina sp.]|jgi:sugar phosphate permease|nr:MFS transporter [Nitrospinota bacterium]MDP6335389.1 MFS transporter [Nitrospinaceae bacterium]MDP7147195.1 MFS transporter [Nitrospinaceae bacterium]HAX46260.1 MFS transporter [Nitrospina sp.]|tara:strand:- start:2914 stop:4233 length:1320 start_codon:yes stop_codon:yes gene_type:complete
MNFTARLKNDPRFYWEVILLACMYGAYAVVNICRATVIIASPAMLDDPTLELDKTAWGAILGWGTAGTIIGKLATGIMADRLGGRKVFLFSLGLCMLATGMFGFMSKAFFFSVAFFVAMFAKAGAWPSMANLTGVWFQKSWRGRAWGIISSSSMSSWIFASLALGSLLLVMSWRWVIASSAVMTGAFAILLYFYLRQYPTDVGLEAIPSVDGDDDSNHPQQPHHLDNATAGEALLNFLLCPRFWLICLSIMSMNILMVFQSFMPLYLKETFDLSSGMAGISSSVFPIGSMFSVLVGGFIFDNLTKKKRIYVLGGMMVLATASILILYLLNSPEMPGNGTLWVALSAIMMFGLMITPCYLIPMNVFSVDFGGKHCGFLVCLIDVAGYLASMAFEFLGGEIADRVNGWQQFLNVMLNFSIIGTITLTLFLTMDHRSLRKPG